MKRLIIIVAILMVCLSSTFAQTTSNVEKAVRYRVQKDTSKVETQAKTYLMNVAEQAKASCVLQNNSSAQLEELGPRRWANCWSWGGNTTQLEELGPRYAIGWSFGGNATQLKKLGFRDAHRWADCWLGGGLPNTTQLKELGSRPRWWDLAWFFNTTQLEELGAIRQSPGANKSK